VSPKYFRVSAGSKTNRSEEGHIILFTGCTLLLLGHNLTVNYGLWILMRSIVGKERRFVGKTKAQKWKHSINR
jgi:hypothetical protein